MQVADARRLGGDDDVAKEGQGGAEADGVAIEAADDGLFAIEKAVDDLFRLDRDAREQRRIVRRGVIGLDDIRWEVDEVVDDQRSRRLFQPSAGLVVVIDLPVLNHGRGCSGLGHDGTHGFGGEPRVEHDPHRTKPECPEQSPHIVEPVRKDDQHPVLWPNPDRPQQRSEPRGGRIHLAVGDITIIETHRHPVATAQAKLVEGGDRMVDVVGESYVVQVGAARCPDRRGARAL